MFISLSKSWIDDLKSGSCKYITWCRCKWKLVKVIRSDGYSFGEEDYLCEMDSFDDSKQCFEQLDLFEVIYEA